MNINSKKRLLITNIDGGDNYGKSIAGTANARTFYKTGYCALLKWGIDSFYFEAFDEPLKDDASGDSGEAANEKHWGAWTAQRKEKFDLTC